MEGTMNAWFSRHQAKGEITELLAFAGIEREHSIKMANGYRIPTSIGEMKILSGYDIRVNDVRIGSVEMFRKHVYKLINEGKI